MGYDDWHRAPEAEREIPCVGGCGETQPDLQDNDCGARRRVGPWCCGACMQRLGKKEALRLIEAA